jgi:hypothetical protein
MDQLNIKTLETMADQLSFGDPSKGSRLPDRLRHHLESHLGQDLSAIRVHEGSLADACGANALAHGTDIHFSRGRFNPDRQDGLELLAHEAVHVAQQLRGDLLPISNPNALDLLVDEDLEYEADTLANHIASGLPGHCSTISKGDNACINWNVMQPNLYISTNPYDKRKLTNTNNTMREIEGRIRGTVYFAPWLAHRKTIRSILHDWINASRNTVKRFITGKSENTRYYISWENLVKALLGEARSLGNLEVETKLAKLTMKSGYLEYYLNYYLDRRVHVYLLKDPFYKVKQAKLALDVKNPYKGEYKSWYPNMAKVICNPEKYSIKNKVAVIHDLNKVFGKLIPGPFNSFTKVPPQKTTMTYLVPNGSGGYIQKQRQQNGTGGFRRGQPPRETGNNEACTLLEDSEVISAARINNMPVEMGPSFTTGRMLQAAFYMGARKPELTAIAWGIFAFWNQVYSKKFSRVHRFHGTMDMAKNYDVDYTPFTYPSRPPSFMD